MKYGFKLTILCHIPKALHMMTACKLNSPAPALLLSANQCLAAPTAQPFQDMAETLQTQHRCSCPPFPAPPRPRALLSIHLTLKWISKNELTNSKASLVFNYYAFK